MYNLTNGLASHVAKELHITSAPILVFDFCISPAPINVRYDCIT